MRDVERFEKENTETSYPDSYDKAELLVEYMASRKRQHVQDYSGDAVTLWT